ncbi:MAG: LysE family translocator [Pseudomonadota bacterium]
MPSLDLMLAFFLAAAVFAYIPGPGMMYAAAQTIAGGQQAGWRAALGIHLGGYVHVVAAGLGLAVLFEIVPILYVILKLLGAAYLIWLGLGLIFRQAATAKDMSGSTGRAAFWQSVTVEVLNPKTAIFYLAFLPQFTDPAAGLPIWGQMLILGTIVNVMFSSADVICVLLSDKVAAMFRRSGSTLAIGRRLGGGILVALGARVALDR